MFLAYFNKLMKILPHRLSTPFFCSALTKFMESGGLDGAAADDDDEDDAGHDEL